MHSSGCSVSLAGSTDKRFATSAGTSPASIDQKIAAPGNFELLNLGTSDQEPDANDAHIVNIVDWLLQYAFGQRASDIHIEPCREQGRVRFRIDGSASG